VVKLSQTITDFHLPLYGGLVVLVMVSCLLSGLLSYLRVERDSSTDKRRAQRNKPSVSSPHSEKEIES
jgi:hypothetical protein